MRKASTWPDGVIASDVGWRVEEMRWVLRRTYLHQRRRTKSCFSASTEGQRTGRSILIDPAYSVSEGDVAVCPALHGRSLTSARWDSGEDNFQIRQRQLWIYLEDDTTRIEPALWTLAMWWRIPSGFLDSDFLIHIRIIAIFLWLLYNFVKCSSNK